MNFDVVNLQSSEFLLLEKGGVFHMHDLFPDFCIPNLLCFRIKDLAKCVSLESLKNIMQMLTSRGMEFLIFKNSSQLKLVYGFQLTEHRTSQVVFKDISLGGSHEGTDATVGWNNIFMLTTCSCSKK